MMKRRNRIEYIRIVVIFCIVLPFMCIVFVVFYFLLLKLLYGILYLLYFYFYLPIDCFCFSDSMMI